MQDSLLVLDCSKGDSMHFTTATPLPVTPLMLLCGDSPYQHTDCVVLCV